jgi:Beta-1,4-xylanase
MPLRATRIICLFLILCSVSLFPSSQVASTQAADAQQEALPWRDKGTPFGVVAALGNRIRADEMPAAVQLMREAGVQWQREELFWHEIQKEPHGPYNWTGNSSGFYNYDRAIQLQVEAGINVLGLLDYNPAWFKGKNPTPEEWIDDWGDFVYNAVARYGRDRGQIKYWELWNEPNLARSGYESGLYEVRDFARILQVGYAAAKAADPEAVIVMGGMASIWGEPPSPFNYDYMDYLEELGKLGAWQHFDIIAIHPYRPNAPEGTPWRNGLQADMRTEFSILDGLLLRYGAKPVWLTELGWHDSQRFDSVDRDTQAFFLVRSYIMALSHPSIEKIFWYDLRNDTEPGASYEHPVYDDANYEYHYGLLTRSYPLDPNRADLRKPAFLAYRTMTQMLAGLAQTGITADGNHPEHPGLFWYSFAGNGRRVDVMWRIGETDQQVLVDCGCREILVRGWNGQTMTIYNNVGGPVTINLQSPGAPIYLEYDAPVPQGGRYFEATGHSLRGAFLRYWEQNGGLERFGYPLTEEMIEPEAGTGRPRIVQYFERNRFEHFPEFSGTIYEVQLGRLGDALLRRQGVDWQSRPRLESAPPECLFFPESGHSICPPFRDAWEANGGLAIVGLPLTEPYYAQRADTGQEYLVQYFERARLEHFPEFAGTRYEVQLGLLAREYLTSP